MKLRTVLFCAVPLVATMSAAPAPEPSDLVVHEWGTFLAMSGSDGVALDGLYHEEHALPAFVHARAREQRRLRDVCLKGETPVIYFYTGQKQKVRVRVDFPHGVWTQWYPQASFVGPKLVASGSPPQLRDGRIGWTVEVTPRAVDQPAPQLPQPGAGALWSFARDVDAAYVRTIDSSWGVSDSAPQEWERFLFYRGLGRATLPLQMTAAAGGTLSLGKTPDAAHGVRHLFVLRIEGGRGAYRYLPALAPGQSVTGAIPTLADAQPLAVFSEKIAADLAARLIESGLYDKEARAMVNTWRASYFGTEGVRVLFVLPQEWTDQFIPLQVSPTPKATVRVMVGRLETLTPARERLAQNAVRDLAATDTATRQRAFDMLQAQGRYVEPILRRVLQTSRGEQVQTLCRRLLLTDFVTELHSAAHTDAATVPTTDPLVGLGLRIGTIKYDTGRADIENTRPAGETRPYINEPLTGGPAAQAGLQARDVILTIDGRSTANLDEEAVLSLLRGERGTPVRLQIERELEERKPPTYKTFDVTLTRDTVVAQTAEQLSDNPLRIRAQLASLLREVGLEAQAKSEAKPVYAALQKMQAPPFNDHEARHYLRAYARTMEGLGDDRGALQWYGQFVRFGSQTKQCVQCHQSDGPQNMAWFRDWWAGRKFVHYAARTGQRDALIAANEATLARQPDDTAAQMMLAYLCASKGQNAKAAALWAKVEAEKPKSKVAGR